VLQERSSLKGEGAEGASLVQDGMKLSGKRTVTRWSPGKFQGVSLDTDGDKSLGWMGIISQVKRQEERWTISSSFLLFFGSGEREQSTESQKHKIDLRHAGFTP
jgi:hypothetical protein